MFGFGKAICFFCDRRVPRKAVFHGRDVSEVAVCVSCYERWELAGRRCVECQTVVHGPQDIAAFFKPRPAFGHADCGGIRLTR